MTGMIQRASWSCLIGLLFTCISTFAAPPGQEANDLKLWYTKPAAKANGHPLSLE